MNIAFGVPQGCVLGPILFIIFFVKTTFSNAINFNLLSAVDTILDSDIVEAIYSSQMHNKTIETKC